MQIVLKRRVPWKYPQHSVSETDILLIFKIKFKTLIKVKQLWIYYTPTFFLTLDLKLLSKYAFIINKTFFFYILSFGSTRKIISVYLELTFILKLADLYQSTVSKKKECSESFKYENICFACLKIYISF